MPAAVATLLLQHALLWLGGYLLLRQDSRRYASCWRVPDALAAHPLALTLACIVAFIHQQALGIKVTAGATWAAVLAIALAGVVLNLRKSEPSQPDATLKPRSRRWTLADGVMIALCLVLFVVGARTTLWTPVVDWDTFYYHVPFARQIAAGTFPDQIGPSFNPDMLRAYPPLFYYLYSLHERAIGPAWSFAGAKAVLVVYQGLSAMLAWQLGRRAARLSPAVAAMPVMLMLLVANWQPNQQAVTSALFLAWLLYAWRALESPAGRGWWSGVQRALVPGVLAAGLYWANYLGLVLLGCFGLSAVVIAVIGQRRRHLRRIEVPVTGPQDGVCVESKRVPHTGPQDGVCLQRKIGAVVLILGVGLLLALPHLLRNWLIAGNPLYPALLNVLGGKGVTAWWLSVRNICVPEPLTYASFLKLIEANRMPAILLAVSAALALLLPARRWGKAAGLAMLAMFLAWAKVLYLRDTPMFRYLMPVMPLAAMVLAVSITQLMRGRAQSRSRALIVLTVLALAGLATAAVSATPMPARLAALPAAVLLACVLLLTLAALLPVRFTLPAVAPWLAGLAATLAWALAAGAWRLARFGGIAALASFPPAYLWSAGTLIILTTGLLLLALARGWHQVRLARLPALAAPMALAAALLIATAAGGSARELASYHLALEPDLRWINQNLPASAVVLTNEDRLIFLQRAHVSVDDPRLQPLYRASTVPDALAVLQSLGITHLYYSTQGPKVEVFEKLALLRPARGSPLVRKLYIRRSGGIAELTYPAFSLAQPTPQAQAWMQALIQSLQATAQLPNAADVWDIEVTPEAQWLVGDIMQALENKNLASLPALKARAVALQPVTGEDHFHLGTAFLLLGDIPKALEQLQFAAKLEPQWAAVHWVKALAHFRLKEKEAGSLEMAQGHAIASFTKEDFGPVAQSLVPLLR